MLKTQVIAEIKSIVQTLTTEFPETPNYICYSYHASDLPQTGEFIFFIYNTKLDLSAKSTVSPKSPKSNSKLNSLEKSLHQFIERGQFLEPTCPEFSQILNYLLTYSKPYLISKGEILTLLKQKLTALRNNQWIIQSLTYEIVDSAAPHVILHVLRKEGNYAMMLQLNQLHIKESQNNPDEVNPPDLHTLTELKNKIQELTEEKEDLLSIGVEKENEIQLLKSQLELGGSSFDEQLDSFNHQIQLINKDKSQLQEELARRDDEIVQLKAKLFDLHREKELLIQEKQTIEQHFLSKIHELERKIPP